ncbi:unnamed protein product, partial [Schistosoma margrebowiei]
MKISISEGKHGTKWTAQNQLDDLDFADDLALLSHTHEQMQMKTASVTAVSASVASTYTRGKPRSSNTTPRTAIQSLLMAKLWKIIYGENGLSNYFILEKPERQDILFMKKTGVLFIENIYHQLLDPSNKVDNLEYLSCTVGLVALEMGAEQVITELFRLILALQTKIIDENTYMPLTHRCALHALLASTITLLVQLINLQSLSEHIYT